MTERAEVISTTEARQASPRRLNLRVLIVSMCIAVAAAGIIYYAIYANPESAIGVPEQPATEAPETP